MTVSGDVNELAGRSLTAQDILARFFSEKDFRLRQNTADRLHFLGYRRRLRIRYAQHQRLTRYIRAPSLAQRINAGTRRIRNGIAVNQMSSPVEQSMEWHIMQQTMRHKNQVPRLQSLCERCDQFVIQFFQVCLRRAYERILKPFQILPVKTKFRKLKLK